MSQTAEYSLKSVEVLQLTQMTANVDELTDSRQSLVTHIWLEDTVNYPFCYIVKSPNVLQKVLSTVLELWFAPSKTEQLPGLDRGEDLKTD
jgi:hypothetical protein